MPEYWIVVRRGRRDLFELLREAFRGRSGFAVIEDRREELRRSLRERRRIPSDWNNTDFFVAERAEGFQW